MREDTGFLDRPDGERLAWRKIEGAGPTVVWLGGFKSDMAGSKAQTLADWAMANGRAYVRFDYLGHGESSGDFVKGTISRWREDALAVIDQLTAGPLVLVGSSMGGWLACLVAAVRAERIAGMVLVAPAADFTEKLMVPEMTAADRLAMDRDGVWMRPSDYGDPYPIARELIEDGARWSILPGPVPVEAPVRILQGGVDPDVPWRHALALAQALKTEDLVFSLIKDGDHRLSRPQDLQRLVAAVAELAP
ncbi:MAG TPA: alpha/beta hydrolase [Phenylobacterium sp.]|jgi:pimeloyl-ACP methyl ester carboxylesterase|uniref:Alpha/beta hydrolase n=1 Tax=Phenylobacterium conjunctum TaxID=1298959 RepID=A0ABW3SXA5_9CAUL|nr:alpha/beta hydrolase [Phenylobacterium sp.]HQP20719.1 alpha/beta hydrolase [Phenylobacterium sp.]